MNDELIKDMYRMMVRLGAVEEAMVGPILSVEVKTSCNLYSGEEAVAVGVCATIENGDMVFGNHRSHGHKDFNPCPGYSLAPERFSGIIHPEIFG